MRRKKPIIISILAALICILSVLAGCAPSVPPEDGETAYAKFRTRYSYTCALIEFDYTVTTEEKSGKTVKNVKLKKDGDGYIAQKTVNGNTEYFVDGVRYYVSGGVNRKAATTVDGFIEPETGYLLNDENVRNKTGISGGVKFELLTAYFDKCIIECLYGEYFITEIKAVAEVKDGGTVKSKTVTIVFNNAGQSPEITLPADLQEYSWI